MTIVETLIPTAFRMGRRAFISEHVGFHLLKPPTPDPKALGYTTLEAPDPFDIDPGHIVATPRNWQACRIEKRPGNPYPDRISVGRANNCDIVLRFGVVSKLHAHFFLSPMGVLQIVDLRSANGTWVNERSLDTGEPVELRPGDVISFGGVRCELIDAVGLFELVSGNRS